MQMDTTLLATNPQQHATMLSLFASFAVVQYNENLFFIFKVFEPKFSDVLALDTLGTKT